MNSETYVVPYASLTEKPEAYELRVWLPGVGKDEAELQVEGKTLTLKTHASFQKPAGFREAVCEFARSNYAMSVDLPDLSDLATLSAQLENGILLVTIAKRAEAAARKIAIA